MAILEISVPLPYAKDTLIGYAMVDHDEERKQVNQERREGMADLNAALNEGYKVIDTRSSDNHRIYLLHKQDRGETNV